MMKKSLTFFILLVFASSVLASNVQEEMQQSNLEVLLVEENADGISIDVRISDPLWADVGLDEELQVVEFNGEAFTDLPGQPQVPVLGRIVRMPISGGAHIEIQDSHYRVYDNINYAAFAGDGLPEELEDLDPNLDSWFPENIVTIGEPAIMKDFRVANIATYPVQVNPARRQVRVYDRLQYRVVYDESTNENSLNSWPTQLSETFLPFYRQIMDWSETELDQYELYRGGVQLVCKEAWLDEMHDWIEWKKQKGWDIQILSDANMEWTRYNIIQELRDRYDAAEIKYDHIVIVGDASGAIATPPGSSGEFYGAGDHYYGLLAGDDQLLDVTIGRISVETSNMLNAYVKKVLAYEKDTYRSSNPEDYGWYKRGSVAAGSASSGISTVYVARYARHVMLQAGYTQVDTAFYNDGHGSVNNRIINQINNGVSFHLYRGFIGSGIENEHINSMTNTEMLPVVIDITCGRGNWADGTSINEAYMRAGTSNSPRGAIAATSTATSSTHTRFNNSMAGGAAEAVFVKKVPTIGQMVVGAKYNMWQNFWSIQNEQPYVRDFNQWLNLMGDPTVWIFTDIPDSTISFHVEDEIELGTRGFEITITDNDGPLEGAWVTLYKSDENEEVISRGVTDESGYSYLNFPAQYTGRAVLTITAINHRPKQQNIEIVSPDDRLGIIGYTILDDGTLGTRGNGNGIAEAGEMAGVLFNVFNFGQATQSDIDISATSNDDNILSVSGNPTMGSLQDGNASFFQEPILVEISDNTPDDWTAVFNISLNGSADDYTDEVGINIRAPKLVFIESTGDVLPGQEGSVTFTIANIGGADIGNTVLTLVLDDVQQEWITTDDNSGTLAPIQVGASTESSSFTLNGNNKAFRGYTSSAKLIAETATHQIHEIPIKIQMGGKNATDPEGPDHYGYFAYDNTDASYIMKPAYNWIEIDPNMQDVVYDGTYIELNDGGEDQDDSEMINLPFDFTYYGETYNTITVCSNGWIAMGNQEGMALQRNWVIPSPLGPWAMIAPYWDDLQLSGSDAGVYYYYLESEGKFIVEWSNLFDAYQTQTNTFQVVLLENSEDFPTPTGDNEFLFNYKDINPTVGSYSDVAYFTTGFENADQQDGLLLSYYNIPSDGTSTIQDETCILISTRTTYTTGTVTGTVTHLSDSTPVEGVLVSSNTLGNSDITDADGVYSILAATGEADIIFRKNGYATYVAEDVTIIEDGSVTVNAQLALPVISIDTEEMTFNLDPGDTDSQQFTMGNSGNANLEYQLNIMGNDPNSSTGGDIGDEVGHFYLPVNNNSYRDCSATGDTIWVMSTNYSTFDTELRLLDFDGTLLNRYSLDFTTDASRFQVTDDIVIIGTDEQLRFYTYGESLAFDSLKTIPLHINMSDFAVDFEAGRIYFISGSNLYEYDFDMHIQQTHFLNIDFVTGIDAMPEAEDGFTVHLLGYTWSQGDPDMAILRYNPETRITETMISNTDQMEDWPNGFTLIKLNNGLNYLVGILFQENYPGVGLYQYINDLSWISLDQENGEIAPDATQTVNVGVDVTDISDGIYNFWIAIRHNAADGNVNIPVVVNVGSVDVEEEAGIPEEWALEGVYPNPFNPTATVKFSLLENVHVNAKLYNILGQQVAILANRPMQTGQHTLTINGESLSSGVYFLKFNAGPLSSVQKVVLLK